MTMVVVTLMVLGLALALAHQKTRSGFRPRGRFAPSVAWGQLPVLPQPEIRLRPRATRPTPVRA